MLTLDEIKERLELMNIKKVAEHSGVHHNAVYRMMKEGSNPRHDTVKKLSDFLEKQSGEK